jgi:hypothetical protein
LERLSAITGIRNNVAKYALYDSKVETYYESDTDGFSLTFDMLSCRIEKSEIRTIFDEGVSGVHATSPGDGIGMYVIRKALSLNGMSMDILPNYAESIQNVEGKYTRNKFIISSRKDDACNLPFGHIYPSTDSYTPLDTMGR